MNRQVSISRRRALPICLTMVLSMSILPALAADSVPKTVFKDFAQKKTLIGKHMLSLQWLQFDGGKFGSANISEKSGVLYLKGEQLGKGKAAGYLKVDGRITEVGKSSFKLNGEIKTSVSHINNGEECVRNGEMTFLTKGKRKYWRLQEMASPCSGVTDYVDVYFN